MTIAPETTKERLVAAAERLFAERGVDAVSLREITRASGARNAVALQYHFADRDGVVAAIVAKHRPDVEARRHALLDQIDADGGGDLRALAGALVRPEAARLADPDGGPEYLRIYAELVNRPRPPVDPESPGGLGGSISRWRASVGPLLAPEAVRLNRRFTAIRFTATELGRRAASGPHTDDRLFVSHLVDLVAAVLAAPVSAETLRLADERDRSRSRRPAARPAPRGGVG